MTHQPDPRVPQGGLSHVRGLTDGALSGSTVHALLADAARRWPARDAAVFVEQGLRFTWQQLHDEIEAAAAGLWALGVRCGDRVGIWSPNRAEWLLTQFATARIGAILVNINPAYRLSELEYALNKSGVSLLVTAAAFKSSNYLGLLQNLGVGQPGGASRLPALRSVVRMGDEATAGMRNWHELMSAGRAALGALPAESVLNSSDAINIQFTSGTTGAPKGATLTHHNIVNNAIAVASCMRFTEQRRAVHPGAAVPLLRHGARRAGLRGHRRQDGVPGRRLRAAGHARCRRGRSLHRAARRADDVHRRTRPSGVRAVRPAHAAHRHHGRRAMPGRSDEARAARHAHARGHHRLRHDRDQPGVVPERHRRPAGQARVHRRPRAAAPGGEDRRRQRQHRGRSARRASSAPRATR